MEDDKVVVVVAARSNSKRFPGKAFEKFHEYTLVQNVVARSTMTNRPVVLSIPYGDSALVEERERWPKWFCELSEGPEHDLVKRHLLASEGYDHVVRVTGDCPFLDSRMARCTIAAHLEGGYDLTIDEAEGRGVQVYKRTLLEEMDRMQLSLEEREHLDIWPLHPLNVLNHIYRIHHMKFSVDTPAEMELARRRLNL